MYKILVAPTTRADQMTLQADMDAWDGVYKQLIRKGQHAIARTVARELAQEVGPTSARRVTLSTNIASIVLDAAGVSF